MDVEWIQAVVLYTLPHEDSTPHRRHQCPRKQLFPVPSTLSHTVSFTLLRIDTGVRCHEFRRYLIHPNVLWAPIFSQCHSKSVSLVLSSRVSDSHQPSLSASSSSVVGPEQLTSPFGSTEATNSECAVKILTGVARSVNFVP